MNSRISDLAFESDKLHAHQVRMSLQAGQDMTDLPGPSNSKQAIASTTDDEMIAKMIHDDVHWGL